MAWGEGCIESPTICLDLERVVSVARAVAECIGDYMLFDIAREIDELKGVFTD